GSDAQASSGLIDLNSVDVITLTSLPGIGQTKAEAIVRHREQNGPFARIEDLLEVSGIGPATFDAILDLIEVR
ncbi:MAG TPA: helix-hairpin-helix domain-containing protein, partial [SAR202 cluster bacterium]|nr:helix-hairpin-helix domain-containing protein [SAR202 cluster bacterium]